MGDASSFEPGLEVTVRTVNGDRVVRLVGELDLSTAGSVEQALREAQSDPSGHVVVDLGGLAFIDSSGLRVLLHGHMNGRNGGAPLSLVAGDARIQRVFQIAALIDELDWVSSPTMSDGRAEESST